MVPAKMHRFLDLIGCVLGRECGLREREKGDKCLEGGGREESEGIWKWSRMWNVAEATLALLQCPLIGLKRLEGPGHLEG